MTRPVVGTVRTGLVAAADPARAARQRAYMKSALPFHGVGITEVRTIVRTAMVRHPVADRDDWEATALELWDGAAHREEWYAAIAVLRRPADRAWLDPRLLRALRHLVERGAWWDVVDEVAAHLVGGVLAAHRPTVTPLLRAWAGDDHLWVRRTAVLAQLRHRDGTDTGLLAGVLDANLLGSPHGSDFFVRKAVGWALRQHARTDAAWVRDYVRSRDDRLSGLSRREALKHLA